MESTNPCPHTKTSHQASYQPHPPTPPKIPYIPPYGLAFTRPWQEMSQPPPLEDAPGGEELLLFKVTNEQLRAMRPITR